MGGLLVATMLTLIVLPVLYVLDLRSTAGPGGGRGRRSRADAGGREAALAWSGVSDKRSYYRLFFAYIIALLATGVATVALAVLAFDLAATSSGAVIGTALSIKMLAYVVAVARSSAALTERMARRPLLIALDLIRAGCLLLLALRRERRGRC